MLFTIVVAHAQNAHCGFDRHLEKMIEQDPSALQTVSALEQRTEEIKRGREEFGAERGGGPRIIPTVFHVIHVGGAENISYAQIEDQMRILNEDYRRLNADTTNTRDVFKPVASDVNVEFRLAKLDPQGNCTDGVVRVWSPKTFNASDDNGVKALSYWNSSKYFNVWVVATIDNEGEAGTILGYAQFPGIGSAQTDGVVVRADFVGNIGTGAGNGSRGRTLTHEAGHWLGLFHTFQGGCTGGFFGEGIDDTPPQAEATPSNCPQNANTCNNDNPDLPDQVENYMDYSNGACQNMFTLGQTDRMDAVLTSSRTQVWSANNLTATGVNDPDPSDCKPYAQFYASKTTVCTGQNISFTDASFNGEVTTRSWSFSGATPSTSSSANPTVVYDAPGLYSVTLTVSNSQGSDSETLTDYVRVLPASAEITSYFSFEGFEETEEDYIVFSDGLGNTWEETNTAFTDSRSIKLNNFSGNPAGSEDEFLLPSVDMTNMTDPKLYFRLAYRERTDRSDNLRVYASRDCGNNWSLRYNKSGAALATVSGTAASAYTPSSNSDWELIEVSMSQFASDEHVLVKFRGTSAEGNNIYIDDIQISGPLGVEDENAGFGMALSPNPMNESSILTLNVDHTDSYDIRLVDVTGRVVSTVHTGTLTVGQHRFVIDAASIPSSGIYLLQVNNTIGKRTQKLVVQ